MGAPASSWRRRMGRWPGRRPATSPLTAADAVDLHRVAAILTEISGRAVRRVVVEDEDFVARLVDHGTPEPFARLFLGSFHASRRGEFAVTDPTLEQLIGHSPTSVRDAFTSEG